jgi:hypothetical protein
VIRAEYDAWSIRFGKTKEDKRYQIFRANFITQMEWNRKTGQFYLLNEFGDMTTEEYYNVMNQSPPIQSTEDVTKFPTNRFEEKTDTISSYQTDVEQHEMPLNFDIKKKDEIEEVMPIEEDTKEWSEYSFAMDFEGDNVEAEEVEIFNIESSQEEPDIHVDVKKGLPSSVIYASTETDAKGMTSSPTFPRNEEQPSSPSSLEDSKTRKALFSKRTNSKQGALSLAMAAFLVSASKMGSIFSETNELL